MSAAVDKVGRGFSIFCCLRGVLPAVGALSNKFRCHFASNTHQPCRNKCWPPDLNVAAAHENMRLLSFI